MDKPIPAPRCPTAYIGAEASCVWAAAWEAGVQAALTAAQQQGQANPWHLAVDHERVTAHAGIGAEGVTREEAAKQLGELIDWHVKVATDPAVNGGFRLMPMQQGGGEVVAWGVFGKSAEYPKPVLLPDYVGSMDTIRQRVMEKARR